MQDILRLCDVSRLESRHEFKGLDEFVYALSSFLSCSHSHCHMMMTSYPNLNKRFSLAMVASWTSRIV